MKTYNTMKPAFITLLAISFFLSVRSVAFSQVINEEVTVTAAYEPSIPDANKINIEPPESETAVPLPAMTYSNRPEQMLVTLKPENIAPVKLMGEPMKKLYRNYVRAGYGTYLTPFLDLYAGSLRSKSNALGLHLKHLSSAGEIEGYPIADNSLNMAELYGMKFLDNHTLSAEAGVRRNVVHHYGFEEELFNENSVPYSYNYNDSDLKQRFTRINALIGINSKYKEETRLNHFASVGFNSLSDKFDTKENTIIFNAGADKRFELFSFTDYQKIGLDAKVNYTNYKDSLLTQNSTLISINPFISTSFNEYSLKAGLKINFVLDSVSKAYLFPFVEGSLRIIDDALVVHAGITGDIKRQSYNELSDINPFVNSILPLDYTREKFTFYAGVRARAGSSIDLSALIKSSIVDNAYFFVNDYTRVPFNRFTIVHDNGRVLNARFEAQYHTAEHIIIKAYTELEYWSLDSLKHAYHMPDLKFGINASYQIQNKVIVRADVAARGKQMALVVNESDQYEDKELKGFADISLGIEYRYTKQLSGFINFNNITNTRYFLWNNYPSYRFNLMAGIAYTF